MPDMTFPSAASTYPPLPVSEPSLEYSNHSGGFTTLSLLNFTDRTRD